MVVLDLSLAYRMTITSVVCPVNMFNVVVSYEQGHSVVTVTITSSEYIIEYGKGLKMVINKDDCDTDRLFQLCTVHPFAIEGLGQLITSAGLCFDLVLECTQTKIG